MVQLKSAAEKKNIPGPFAGALGVRRRPELGARGGRGREGDKRKKRSGLGRGRGIELAGVILNSRVYC